MNPENEVAKTEAFENSDVTPHAQWTIVIFSQVIVYQAFIHVHIGMSVSIEKKRTKLTGLERKCSDGLILDGFFHLFSCRDKLP